MQKDLRKLYILSLASSGLLFVCYIIFVTLVGVFVSDGSSTILTMVAFIPYTFIILALLLFVASFGLFFLHKAQQCETILEKFTYYSFLPVLIVTYFKVVNTLMFEPLWLELLWPIIFYYFPVLLLVNVIVLLANQNWTGLKSLLKALLVLFVAFIVIMIVSVPTNM